MQLARILKIALLTGVATSITVEAFAMEAAATTTLNVRTGPGTEFAVVDTLFSGERVNASECQTNGWCFVTHDGPDGWVSGKYLGAIGGNYGSGSNANSGSGANSSSGSSGGSSSSSDKAAEAAAAIALFGLGALVIGGAIASANQNNNNAPHPDACVQGYVWREARSTDHVCVTPQRRAKAQQENATAASRVNPLGPFGPKSCKFGFVWRMAFPGDQVCVIPARRTQVKQENIDGPSHRLNP